MPFKPSVVAQHIGPCVASRRHTKQPLARTIAQLSAQVVDNARWLCACGGRCPRCAGIHVSDIWQTSQPVRELQGAQHDKSRIVPTGNTALQGWHAGRCVTATDRGHQYVTTGNATTARVTLPNSTGVQARLEIGASNDAYEQEAHSIADEVVHMPEPSPHGTCVCGGECPRCKAEQKKQKPNRVQPKVPEDTRDHGMMRSHQAVHATLKAPGQPLDQATRAFMEPRFERDFSQVRIHTDALASQSALSIGAFAYVIGNHIMFRAGCFAPHLPSGRRLLAHELTHVCQQEAACSTRGDPASGSTSGSALCIQRAVTYDGVTSVSRDIDFFDPSTHVVVEDDDARRGGALGITRMAVDGTIVQWKELEPSELLDLFFPLPAYSKSKGECVYSGSGINLSVTNQITVLKDPPWTSIVDHADLGKIVHAELVGRPGCSGGKAEVIFTGEPSSEEFHKWLIEAEQEHAADNACLVNKYLVGYERDVAALPNVFPAGPWGIWGLGWAGDCNTRLEERLQRVERFNKMGKEIESMRLWHDFRASPGRRAGPHIPSSTVFSDPHCTRIVITMHHEDKSPWHGSCEPWSPLESP